MLDKEKRSSSRDLINKASNDPDFLEKRVRRGAFPLSTKARQPSERPEEIIRQKTLRSLRDLGWNENQLRWKPEWQIPDTPHDLTKRERGQRFEKCGSADLVAFADASQEWFALQIIFEFKAPNIEAGRAQLLRYLSNEPMAKMGFWTNGSQTLAIYKSHVSDWTFVKGAPLPGPNDNLITPAPSPITWLTLREPSEVELSGSLRRIVDTIVVRDTQVTRREDQLRELLHLLLVKLESDAVARRSGNQKKPVSFRLYGNESNQVSNTAQEIRSQYRDYFHQQRNRIFHQSDRETLMLNDDTIFTVVAELCSFRILGDRVDLLAKAFQIFRTSALRSGEGQYLTPLRIVRPAVMALEITTRDKVIDPACGTGAFLVEALRQVAQREFPNAEEEWHFVKWANDNLYGVDKDDIGVKLTRATMVALKDGSSHILLGDSISTNNWPTKYPKLAQEIGSASDPHVQEQFTVVVTNPPFGVNLKVKASDCRASGYTISNAAAQRGPNDFVDLEVGLIFLELSFRLLRVGGRIGIVLPETYFFSYSYRWLPDWLKNRLALRGMLNIPMEAFEEFCRAKTNFYIFEKIHTSVPDDQISFAGLDN